MSENGLQLFQFQGWGDAEHAPAAVETAVGDEDVTVGIETQEIPEGLDGDDGAGNGIVLWDGLLEEDFQGLPGRAAQIGKKLPIIEEVTAEDFRDAEYKMMVGDLFEDIHAEPLSELYHAFLVA